MLLCNGAAGDSASMVGGGLFQCPYCTAVRECHGDALRLLGGELQGSKVPENPSEWKIDASGCRVQLLRTKSEGWRASTAMASATTLFIQAARPVLPRRRNRLGRRADSATCSTPPTRRRQTISALHAGT